MQKLSIFFWISRSILLICFALHSCANPIPPTGGLRDETPPKVVEAKSTPNFQTNFQPTSIELTFDEWVKLKNANQQVIISPPFEGFSVRLKGKTMILDLGSKDTLRDNVTYVVQFGESIIDLTEGNPAEDLRFVFSTGPQIDSLELTGKVQDAYTGKVVEKALVLLYENQADSVFRTQRPFYFGKTDENGRFNIYNMRPGTYKVCALVDTDANYKFNQVTESIAFLNEPVVIHNDSSLNLSLRLFQEQLPLQLIDSEAQQGLMKLVFNQNPAPFLQTKGEYSAYKQSFDKDTAFIWHQSALDWTLYLSADTTFYDTIGVAALDELQSIQNIQLKRLSSSARNPFPTKNFSIPFTQPLIAIDTSLAHLYADSSLQALAYQWSLDSIHIETLQLSYPFKENTTYRWQALPGAVSNFYGQSNTDTLELIWTSSAIKKFGNISFNFTTADSTQAYFVKVVKKDKPPIASFVLQGALDYNRILKGINPDDYQLEIIFDDNANGRWDAGHYDAQQQPERVIIRPIEKLRANWDLEVEVDLRDGNREE